jgi:phospholipid-transporting ATPase
LLPLTVVVSINGLKDFLEDWKRKKSDDEENNRTCQVFDKLNNTFCQRKWEEIKLGDILKINENEYFPADLVLMNSSEPNGICYIETKNLDGETNLKFKQANGDIARQIIDENQSMRNFQGKLECKKPNEFIYEFDGKFTPNQGEIQYLDKNCFLLRGCSLRQTQYVYGFVVYVGHNTKIMKNSPSARHKMSRIENIMNIQIIVVFLMQTVLCVLGAVFYLVWLGSHSDQLPYIFPNNKEQKLSFMFFFYRIGTWTLIFTNLVPISLLVTLETIKYIQGMFICWDIHMYDRSSRTPGKVQTSTLNEELGQVKVK